VVGVSAGGGTATPGTKVTITVTMNEAMTVSGKPTLSLNDGGTATYSGGSGTNTLTFTSTISTGNVAVPALAITGVNLPAGSIIVDAARARGRLTVRIVDNGSGLPASFSNTSNERLGLQIVRTLIAAELNGTIELRARSDGDPGTEAVVSVPIARQLPDSQPA
jgi:two-component sensor histidine kinase